MKLKHITAHLLLVFVGVSMAFLVVKETRPKGENANPVGQTTPAQEAASILPLAEKSASTAVAQANPKASGAVAAVASFLRHDTRRNSRSRCR